VPLYRFLIHARLQPRTRIVGLYATRSGYARDAEAAEVKALRKFRKDWEKESETLGEITKVEVEEHWRVFLRDSFRGGTRGYTFYSEPSTTEGERAD